MAAEAVALSTQAAADCPLTAHPWPRRSGRGRGVRGARTRSNLKFTELTQNLGQL
jgi:hypothetical protein